MKLSRFFLIMICTLSMVYCKSNNKKKPSFIETQKPNIIMINQNSSKIAKAYFASGCFWCVEAVFESVKGVDEVISGYSGGRSSNPTYQQIGNGNTDHAESVEVYYDPKKVSFEELVVAFFGSHDPTQINGQGPDKGRQYRSMAFYQNDKEKKIIEQYIQKLERDKVYSHPIVTQVVAFDKFWNAEDYHQNYEKENPNNPYIRAVSIPRLKRFQSEYPNLLKEKKENH